MQKVKNIQEIETAVNQYGEIVIKKNKKNGVISMSMEEYKNNLLGEDIEKNLLKSEEDYNNGNVRKAEDVFREWKAKYGI